MKLGFGSAEAMHTQLGHWGVPNWIIYGNQEVRGSAPSTTAQTNRKGRSSSQAEEGPPASFGYTDEARQYLRGGGERYEEAEPYHGRGASASAHMQRS
jgi:hypothetical protein